MMSIGGDEPAIVGFVPPSSVAPSSSGSSRFRHSISAAATEQDVADREAAVAASNAAFLKAMLPPPPPPPPTPPPVEEPHSFESLAAANAALPALSPPIPRSSGAIDLPALLQPTAVIAPLSELDADMTEMPFSGEDALPYEENEVSDNI